MSFILSYYVSGQMMTDDTNLQFAFCFNNFIVLGWKYYIMEVNYFVMASHFSHSVIIR